MSFDIDKGFPTLHGHNIIITPHSWRILETIHELTNVSIRENENAITNAFELIEII